MEYDTFKFEGENSKGAKVTLEFSFQKNAELEENKRIFLALLGRAKNLLQDSMV